MLSIWTYQFLIGYISNVDTAAVGDTVATYQFLIGYISNDSCKMPAISRDNVSIPYRIYFQQSRKQYEYFYCICINSL